MYKNRPNISGFVDFCIYHSNGEPIYIYNGKIVADRCLQIMTKTKYNFLFEDSKRKTEKAIQENLYMFDIEEVNDFYYPNTNMFSMSNAENNLRGYVLTLKKKYRS